MAGPRLPARRNRARGTIQPSPANPSSQADETRQVQNRRVGNRLGRNLQAWNRQGRIRQKPSRKGRKTGLAPGTPIFIGERKLSHASIDLIQFDAASFREIQDVDVRACQDPDHPESVRWINVNGVHDIELIEALGALFDLHPMTLEDIVNTTQRPKWEEFPHYCFVAMKMLDYNETSQSLAIEHVSLILGANYVISFLEDEGDVFDSVRHRIRTGAGRVRAMKADYLAFCLMDTVVDHYFLAVERIGDRVELYDDKLLVDPSQDDMLEIHRFKRGLLGLRKAVWPLREVVGAIAKSETELLRTETRVFWRDLYDHSVQVIDMVETSRDILTSMHDTYLSSLSNRMNEVMKTLTIISTIFIPLTFIAGVYGMNFQYMPGLNWAPGYYVLWAIMIAISLALIIYFRRKKWI